MEEYSSFLSWGWGSASSDSTGSRGRSAFQWGASVSALLLLILNQIGRKSGFQASLLVIFLVTSIPTLVFNILRAQFGYWVAFIAVIANLCFPRVFPVSRFLFFVITPNWLADELRYSISGGVFCLALAFTIAIAEIRAAGGFHCQCNWLCLAYCLTLLLLFFFTILYLCLGPCCDRSTSAPGYACNGMKESCQTNLIYRAQPPFCSPPPSSPSVSNNFSRNNKDKSQSKEQT